METRKGPFEILYQDDDLLVIDKPAGYFVHPPEANGFRVPRSRICLSLLRAQVRRFVYPIHRLDAATSGVLVWALHEDSASELNRSFREQQVKKTYEAVVRGFVPSRFTVDLPLESDSTGDLMPSCTDFEKLAEVELDAVVGKKYPKARYSWVRAFPRTGRFHQIRRHLNRISHPILGDADHGDSHHNRFFRDSLGISGLCLRAFGIEFPHPRTGDPLRVTAAVDEKWKKIRSVFGERAVAGVDE
jgi:tRNA pseudouridine65 synthase